MGAYEHEWIDWTRQYTTCRATWFNNAGSHGLPDCITIHAMQHTACRFAVGNLYVFKGYGA